MIKKAAIYDPYLDTLGGGERYCLTVAEILLKHKYKVDIFWSGDQSLIKRAEKRFSLKLKKINIVDDIFGEKPRRLEFLENSENLLKFINKAINPHRIHFKLKNITNKIKNTHKYDILFYLSDGSTPLIFAKKNFLHVQVPFAVNRPLFRQIIDKPKMKFISNVVCNSEFTAKFQKNIYKNKVLILYPPVDIDKFKSGEDKENIILSVGRFDNILNAKKQDILIDAFKKLIKEEKINGWKLILAGGSLSDPSKNSYLQYLQKKSKKLPIEFLVNPSFEELQKTYSKSKIYWHAAGFNVNENLHPENTEHFGITIVEAMASGLVPIVISKGGIPEIIEDGTDGFLWSSLEELIMKTRNLINNPEKMEIMGKQALLNCQRFSKENFEKSLLSIFKINQ
ncbi:MAG: glycosyltransferase family 4 protein [Candidatus Shapirobacteria bacterium]|nr:glycosyltransferase family 4 protein [Candidatus Shapirobacteria bacterium]